MYPFKVVLLPSFLLALMGTIDCATTLVGTMYYGAIESNPIMATVVGNVPLFIALKLAATFCIAGTYISAKRILNSTEDKNSKGFLIGSKVIEVAYAGLVVFLMAIVVNNLIVMLA
jgi:hypothetical protein